MPWTHRTNWSRSPLRPSAGSSAIRITMPGDEDDDRARRRATTTSARSSAPGSAAQTRPDAQYRSADPATSPMLGHRPAVGADRLGHLALAVEQALDLALVQADAHDLALELVGDVGVLGPDADVVGQRRERVGAEVVEALEVVPPGVREVLVEDDDARRSRVRASPSGGPPGAAGCRRRGRAGDRRDRRRRAAGRPSAARAGRSPGGAARTARRRRRAASPSSSSSPS